ncbi:MAG: ATP-binding cassette domain-containing protein [Desulfuromonadaceae bacterium]|nr:ATP-binding cassette domain-containing protein [Desulfuromonas sp.]MDY0185909.1 ATP-binding cassette domain-containing protein [Desulfuromonadaceae bacterium]
MKTLLHLNNVSKTFSIHSRAPGSKCKEVRAVSEVNLCVHRGEVLGLVGESGCGKSTLGKLATRLLPVDSGSIYFDNIDITHLSSRRMRPLRRKIQMVFQDPFSSLNPRMRVQDILAEPFIIHRLTPADMRAQVEQNLRAVGLDAADAQRYPHEFSGGQRQRIGIARALSLHPELIIADEPVSALDLSVQAQILALLHNLKREFSLTYVFISHDLSVVQRICTRVAVMYLGRIVETSPTQDIFEKPLHPYTEMLLQALPVADPHRRKEYVPSPDIPSALSRPDGCPFHPRCPYAIALCAIQQPELVAAGTMQQVACHRYLELQLRGL